MKINLRKREQLLIIVTVLLGTFVLLYQVGFSKLYHSLAITSSELEKQKTLFSDYLNQFSRKSKIEQEYKEIEAQFPLPAPDRKPAQQFSEEVDALCRQLGFSYPNIEPPKDELIENVDDYKFITLTIRVEGPLKNIAQLLNGFHTRALLIRELNLSSARDQDRITAIITAARIAKLTPEEMEKIKSKKSSEGRRLRSSQQRFHY